MARRSDCRQAGVADVADFSFSFCDISDICGQPFAEGKICENPRLNGRAGVQSVS